MARKPAPDTFLSILPISENGFYVQFIMEVKICECSQLHLYVSVKLVITHEISLFSFISSVFVFKPPQISVHWWRSSFWFLIWNMDNPTNRNASLTINNKLIEVIVLQIKYFSKNSFWFSLSIFRRFYYYEFFNNSYTIVVLVSFEARSFIFSLNCGDYFWPELFWL